ncbi:MAG TPA: YfhO family protein, partial [Chloroflexota bacterium]|nr:YfhO family protein [Chloroflexota bacterium]
RFGATRLGQLVLAWLIGLALAAPVILTFLEYTRVSFTAHEGWQRLGLQAAPLADLVLLWVPEWRGMSVVSLLDGSTYAGASVVLLALVSLYPARTRLHRQLTAFFAIAAGLLLAKIYGAPIISAIGLLPGLNVTFIPKWSAPVASFCIAFLAGLGIQRLLTDGAPSKTRTRALAILLALTVVGILLNWNTLLRPPIARAAFGLGIFLVFAFVSWHVLGLGKRFAATGVALLCCQLVVLELFAYGPHNTYQKRFDLLAEPPFATFLRQQEAGQPSRIFALDGILYPNLATTYGMSDIRALDALYPERYLDYIRNFVSPDVIDRFSGDPDGSTEGPARIVGNPWFDLTGVRYVVTTPEDTSLSHCPPVSCQYRGIYTGEVQVFENTHALPRAFLVGRVKVVDGPQAAIAAMKQESVDPRDLAIVETLPGNAPGDVLPGGGNAEIIGYASSNVTIAVDASAPSLLVLTDTYYPGWKATVDGREAPIFATDLAFRGVRVPAGHHLVAFSYDPVTFRLGLAVGFIGLVALLLFAAWPRITRQHH